MRGLRAALLPLFLALVVLGASVEVSGCKRKKKVQAAPQEPAAVLLSVVDVADPVGSVQLASGFFGLESNSWRWTEQKFTVVLRPPDGAAQRGARLELHLNLPGAIVDPLGPITVSAEIRGRALEPERYSQAGDHVYTRDVDPRLLGSAAVPIHFSTDKALPPTGPDTRRLALIVTSAGLVAK
jgi:hypothetical protein